MALMTFTHAGSALGATYQVAPGGSNSWRSIVGNAQVGDTVTFADGTYTANCSSESSMLSIKAGITLQAENPGHVVLDAKADSSNACRVLYIDSSSGSVKVNGINITGGYLSGQFSGAGVTIYAYVMGVDVILDRCSIYGNIATYGAGVSSHGSTVTFRGCNFYNNAASHLGGGIDIHSGNVTIDSCNMYGNTAAGGGQRVRRA